MLVAAVSLSDQLIVAVVSAVLALIVGGLVGGLVAYLWDDRRRRRESDLAAVDSFYRNYGEFFATWKLWEVHSRYGSPADVQWRLLERAGAAEAGFEALLVKLASERRLKDRDIRLLGSFREAYQTLREQIRQNRRLRWRASEKKDADETIDGFREYRAFKSLAEYVALILEASPGWRPGRRATPPEAIEALRAITDRGTYHHNWLEITENELGYVDARFERLRASRPTMPAR